MNLGMAKDIERENSEMAAKAIAHGFPIRKLDPGTGFNRIDKTGVRSDKRGLANGGKLTRGKSWQQSGMTLGQCSNNDSAHGHHHSRRGQRT